MTVKFIIDLLVTNPQKRLQHYETAKKSYREPCV